MPFDKVCPICNREFTSKKMSALTCGDKACIREFRARKAAAKFGGNRIPRDTDPLATIYRRQCHDCGRPENNYRCPSCLRKWQKKHNVNPGEEDEWT